MFVCVCVCAFLEWYESTGCDVADDDDDDVAHVCLYINMLGNDEKICTILNDGRQNNTNSSNRRVRDFVRYGIFAVRHWTPQTQTAKHQVHVCCLYVITNNE